MAINLNYRNWLLGSYPSPTEQPIKTEIRSRRKLRDPQTLSVVGSLRQEGHDFKANLGYIARPWLRRTEREKVRGEEPGKMKR